LIFICLGSGSGRQTPAERPSLLPHLLFALDGCDGGGFAHKCFVICGIKKRRHIGCRAELLLLPLL